MPNLFYSFQKYPLGRINLKNALPVFWFPTKTLMIDDDGTYLDNIAFALSDALNIQSFHSVDAALEELTSSQFIDIDQTVELTDLTQFDHSYLVWNQENIVRAVFDPKRFNRVTTIICDYSMPEMNGIEFFQKVSTLPVKKILLTGKADTDVAIDAFNAGIIDFYIKKGPKTINEILNQLPLFQRQVFIDASQMVLNTLKKDLFFDVAVINKVQTLLVQHDIAEFYLLNSTTFLLVKRNGQLMALLLLTEQDIDDAIHDFDDYDDFDSDVLEAISQRQQFPFFLFDEQKSLPPTEWKTCLYPLEVFTGNQTYYYSLIDYPQSPFSHPICSYAHYNQAR